LEGWNRTKERKRNDNKKVDVKGVMSNMTS